MASHDFNVRLAPLLGGPLLCWAYEEIGRAQGEVWRELPAALESVRLVVEGEETCFEADWSELARLVLATLTNEDEVPSSEGDREQRMMLELAEAFAGLAVRVTAHGSRFRHLERSLQYYLATVFLAANIAAPGSAVFYGAGDVTSAEAVGERSGISYLDGELLASAWEAAIRRRWPRVARPSLSNALGWLINMQLTGSADSACRTQRALYALLHAVGLGGLPGPSQLAWMACALEAIADTPPAGIEAVLHKRMVLALGQPEGNAKAIKRCFARFYSLRSRVVHGNYGVLHPAADEESDAYVVEASRFGDELDFSISVVMAALQVLVTRGWKGFVFDESVRGC